MSGLEGLPEFENGGLSLRFADPGGDSCFGMCLRIESIEGAAEAVSFLVDLGESVGNSLIPHILYAERDAGTPGFEEVGAEGHTFDDLRDTPASGTIHTFAVGEGLLVDVFVVGTSQEWAYLIAGLSKHVVAQVFPGLATHIEHISDGEWAHAAEAIRKLLPENYAKPDEDGYYMGAVVSTGEELPDTAEFLRKMGAPEEEIASVQEAEARVSERKDSDSEDLDWD